MLIGTRMQKRVCGILRYMWTNEWEWLSRTFLHLSTLSPTNLIGKPLAIHSFRGAWCLLMIPDTILSVLVYLSATDGTDLLCMYNTVTNLLLDVWGQEYQGNECYHFASFKRTPCICLESESSFLESLLPTSRVSTEGVLLHAKLVAFCGKKLALTKGSTLFIH